jgi:type IV secretory pathway VirB10-like protein
MLKLSTKCSISAFNAQGSRGIIVAVQVGAVKIYVAAMEALRKKERQGETQKPSNLMVF